jgi:UDP-N-acetylglucosamine 2-epimerase
MAFCTNKLSKKNLLSDGIDKSSITITGNTVIDALNWILNGLIMIKIVKKI